MAQRHWVGGTANWDGTAGTKWALTAGGAGGQAVPTAADDVFFDASSTGTCTIPSATTVNCRSIDCTGFTATLAFAATTSKINVGDASGGALKFVAGMTLTLTAVGTITFVSTTASTTYTLTTGGKTMPTVSVNTGSTTTIQLADNFTSTGGTLQLAGGILDLNSKTVSAFNMNISSATTRTLTMGSAAITLTVASGTGLLASTTTGLTVTANTATMTFTGAPIFNSGAVNYNGLSVSITGSGNATITAGGAFTIANLTRTGTAVFTDSLSVSGPFTVTGTLTLTGNSITNRLLVQSSTVGTSVTITCNTTITASNLDLMDITAGGSTAPWNLSAITGKSGDCGGNSSITFTTAAAQTATGTSGFTWSTHSWSGAGGVNRVPLPQDDVSIPNSFSASQTITADMARLGKSITFTCSGSPTWNTGSGTASVFGSLILVSGVTPSGSGIILCGGRSTYSVTSAGATFTQAFSFSAPGGTYTLTDALVVNSSNNILGVFASSINLAAGTLTASSNVSLTNATSGVFTSAGTTLNMGTGTWTINDTVAITIWSAAGTVNASTSTIVLAVATSNTRTFTGGGNTYSTLTYTVAGSTGQLTMSDGNTFDTINFSDTSNARTLQFASSSTTTITNNFNVNGTSGKLMSITASTSGTAATLSKSSGDISCDFLSIKDSTATGGANWFAGANSTNVSGNSGWIFSAFGRYWVGGTANWDGTAGSKWSTTSGGTGGASIPTASIPVFFTSSSTGTATIPASTTVNCRSIDCTGFTGTLATSLSAVLNIGDASGGSLKFVSGMTLTNSGATKTTFNFVATTASTTYTITTGGKVLPNVTINCGSTTTIQFADNFSNTGATLTLTAGILDMNGKTVSSAIFSSTNTNTRTLTMGAATYSLGAGGSFTAWDTSIITNLTISSNTAAVSLVNATFASGAINFNGTSVVMTNASGGTYTVNAVGAFTVANFTCTGGTTLTDTLNITGPFTVTGTLTLAGNSAINRLLVESFVGNTASPGTSVTITCNTTVTASNVDFMDITAGGSTAPWNLSAITGKSGDCGGNSSITFTTAAAQTATGTSGFTWSTHAWSGAGGVNRVPLPQDNVFIPNAFSASQTITADMPRLGKSIDFTGATGSPTLSTPSSYGVSLFGSLTLVSGMTTSGTSSLAFRGRSSFTLISAGVTFTESIIFNSPSGTYTLADAFTTNSNNWFVNGLSLVLNNGSLVANSNVSLTGTGGGYNQGSGSLTMGSGTWSIGNTTAGGIFSVGGGTVSGASATIVITGATSNTRTISGGGNTYGTLTYTVAGSTGTLQIADGNTFGTINFSDASNARTLTLAHSTTTTITTAFNVLGTSGKLMTLNSDSAGTAATLSKAGGVVSVDYLSVQDSAATGGASWFAGPHSTNVSGNSGWVFTSPPDFLPFF